MSGGFWRNTCVKFQRWITPGSLSCAQSRGCRHWWWTLIGHERQCAKISLNSAGFSSCSPAGENHPHHPCCGYNHSEQEELLLAAEKSSSLPFRTKAKASSAVSMRKYYWLHACLLGKYKRGGRWNSSTSDAFSHRHRLGACALVHFVTLVNASVPDL